MPTVTLVRYALAQTDDVNVIYWQTREGTAHYITLTPDWYEQSGGSAQAAVRRFVDTKKFLFDFNRFEYMGRMYNVPNGNSICENVSGSPLKPYGPTD